jgi:hypothetical protein
MGDPLGNKIVASLARPGANIAGLSVQSLIPSGHSKHSLDLPIDP